VGAGNILQIWPPFAAIGHREDIGADRRSATGRDDVQFIHGVRDGNEIGKARIDSQQ